MTKNIDLIRRKFLASVSATATAFLTSSAAAAGDGQDDGQSAGGGSQPLPAGSGPPTDEVNTRQKALDYVEEQMQDYTNRPTNSYLGGGSGATPQLAYDVSRTTDIALRKQVRAAARAWARAINKGAPLSSIQFRVYRAKPGEPYEYVASYELYRGGALDYTGGVMHDGTIGRDQYFQWAYDQLKRR